MYNPAHFVQPDLADQHALMRAHPLGLLITHGPQQGLDANHLPFDLAADEGAMGVLRAHVARANPLWQQCADGAEVLVVFRGEAGYISPNWYPSKQEAHKQVPTWNYEVVHAHGRLRIRDDVRFVRGLVARLTRTHEANQTQPWKMGDAPSDYLDDMLSKIVGLEVEITRIEAKSKLSQNKDARDRQGAIGGLTNSGASGLAQAMQQALDGGAA